MFNDDRIWLGSSWSFMSHRIKRSLHCINRRSDVIVVINTGPSKTHDFQFLLQIRIHWINLSLLFMDQRYSYLVTIIMFPKILSHVFQQIFNSFKITFYCKDKNLSLRSVLVDRNNYLFFSLGESKNCQFLPSCEVNLW